MFIRTYTDCFSDNFIIIQGRTSNGTFVNGLTCKGFTDCTSKLCEISNNSNVDWTCILNDSPGDSNIINYYTSNTLYVLLLIIILLLFLSIALSILACSQKIKINKLNEMCYQKMNKVQSYNYDDEIELTTK